MSMTRGQLPKLIICLSSCFVAPANAQNVDAHAPDTSVLQLEQAVLTAVEQNPGLASLQAQSAAMHTLPSQVGALPDPTLSLNAMNLPADTFRTGQEPMTQMQLAISQSFPFPGKRDLKREATEHRANASDALVAERRTSLTGEVRSAWWQLMYHDRALQIIEQNKELLRDFVEIAETKYRVGNGLQQDVLLAQLELSRLLDRELRIVGLRRGAQAEINALLGRQPDRDVTLPTVPPNSKLPALPPGPALLQMAGASRDLIDVNRDLLQSAQADLEFAKRDRYPDFRLGVGYGFRDGFDPLRGQDRSDLVSVMLSVNIPLYSGAKQSKAIDQRSHEVSRQNFALSDTLRRVESGVMRNAAEYRAARDQVELLESAIIPQAQQTVSSMLAGYQVNQVDFLNVINTQITLYNAQISYWESLSRAKQSLARLASAVGEEALYE
jgi:outer membrane protein TolC